MDENAIQVIISGSNSITTWSMSIIAASLLAIISSSYVKPVGKWTKLIYLVFIPGWIYLALAINAGNIIVRRSMMATLNPARISFIIEKINDDYAQQLNDFNMALIFFGIWLLLYLIWWVFQDFFLKK
jgi:hypothetical protein